MMSEYERNRQAFLLNTTPEYVTRKRDEDFWYNLEYEISSNNGFGSQVVPPMRFVEQLEGATDPRFPLELSLAQIAEFYIYANPVVQAFLMQFINDSPETAIWQLNNVLQQTLDDDTQAVLIRFWGVLRDYIYEYGDQQAGAQACLGEQVQPRKTQFRERFEREEKLNRELERVAVPADPFAFRSVNRVYRIRTNTIRNINQLFDQSQVSPDVPLIVTADLHKVLKGHPYSLSPLPRDTATTALMYVYTSFGRVDIQNRFSDTLPPERRGYYVSYNVKRAEDDLQAYPQLIARVCGLDSASVELVQTRVNGTVKIPGVLSFSVDLWRDFVMNDTRAANFIAIDETQLTRERTDDFEPDDSSAPGPDPSEAGGAQDTFSSSRLPHVYLSSQMSFEVDIQSDALVLYFTHLESAEQGAEIATRVAQLVGLYASVRRSLLQEYQLFTREIVLFPTPIPATAKTTKQKPAIYKVFGANFSRAVGSKVPTLLTSEEARRVQQAGFQVLRFPKTVDLGPNETPMYFSCHERSDGHTFPGLLLNPVPGSKYPLLPCCYKEDQLQKRNSNAYEYYRNPEATFAQFRTRQKDRAFVDVDRTDVCPERIAQLYYLNGTVSPVRWGVHRSPLSALECILYAIDYKGTFRKTPTAQRLGIVEAEYARLARDFPYYSALCAQEGWDRAYPTLPRADEYFDLRIWVRLVELAYSVRVVMFSAVDFIFPRHIQGRWIWVRDASQPVVVLYEHYGSTTVARASFPQCEWITFSDLNPAQIDHHYVDSYYIEAAGSTKLVVDQEQLLNALVDEGITLESQHIDFYGKVYAWNVRRDNTPYTLFFRHIRLPPLHYPQAEPTDVFYGRMDDLATGVVGNQQFLHVGAFECMLYTEAFEESVREAYEVTRNQVDLLTENAKRLYALRLNEGKAPTDWSFIQVDASRAYRAYDRFKFQTNTVLYVPNTVTQQRLQYLLNLFRKRNTYQLLSYASATTVPFEYRSIADYLVYNNAIVMNNTRTIQWNTPLYQPIQPTGREVYDTPFLTWVGKDLYRCFLTEDRPSGTYRIACPQTKQLFVVGTTTDDVHLPTFLVTKNPDTAEYTFYRCTFLPFSQ